MSPKLLDLYAEDGLTLDQLMALTVTADHARQEAAWEALSRGHGRDSYAIRRMLTVGAIGGIGQTGRLRRRRGLRSRGVACSNVTSSRRMGAGT